ncbi:ScbA/BarX family gamma-butyrolactone biosynthesis protein [Kitasatospora atroaurantiaca]|nr:ScbA/BarX family gamma-butyrolactone biosynthesis protein [Kitasatospora atroaurantiaca]
MGSLLSDADCLLTEEEAGSPELHQQTVPRKYVHRASVAEVLLTGWRQVQPDHFILGAQWPRTHSFYRPVAGVHDPLLLAETIRQAGMLLAHAGYGVPLDYPFLLWDVSYQADPARMTVEPTPVDLTIRATCHELRFRRGVLAGMRCDTDIYRDGERLGGGSMRLDCMPPETYARIRGPLLAAAKRPMVPAQADYRGEAMDRVLEPTGEPYHWRIQADRRHPVLFDHPVDHVPGMVLVEAMRQAAGRVAGRRVVAPFGLDADFVRYAELHLPVFVRAFPGPLDENGGRVVRVVAEQGGEPVARGVLNVRPISAEPGQGGRYQ